MGFFSQKTNYKKRSNELIGLGGIGGSIILTMEDDDLTEFFLHCTKHNKAEKWSDLFVIIAAGYSYLESKEGKKNGGRFDNPGPILGAIRDAIIDWKPNYEEVFEDFMTFIKSYYEEGYTDNESLSVTFLYRHFKRQPPYCLKMEMTMNSLRVRGIIYGVLRSQFQPYWR